MTDTDWPAVRKRLAERGMNWHEFIHLNGGPDWTIPLGDGHYQYKMDVDSWRPDERWDQMGMGVEAMRAAGWWDIVHDYSSTGNGKRGEWYSAEYDHYASAWADTEPRARCLAAYRALEGDDEDGG